MDISSETARAKIERWREDRSQLLVNFHTSEGGTILPARVDSLDGVIRDRLLLKLDRGLLIVKLEGTTFADETDTKPQHDSLMVKFPQSGTCYLRVMEEWPDVITDEANDLIPIDLDGQRMIR